MSHPSIPLPEVLSSSIVYKGFFDLREDLLQLPHGPKQMFTILMTGCDAAAIIAETETGDLIITKEYRHPVKHWLLSCPGGRLDRGESPIEGARRELLEETGYGAEEFVQMGSVYPFPAVSDQKIHFIWAKKAVFVQPTEHEPFELIHVTIKKKRELLSEIASGNPVDGILCTALFLRSLQ